MSFDPIIIVAGEPNGIFLELLFKSIKKIKIKSPIILIVSKKIFEKQMKKLNFKFDFNNIDQKSLNRTILSNKMINIIDIHLNQKSAFQKISSKSNQYIKKSFEVAFKILKKGISRKLINGPISKKYFLKGKYLGITEFIANKFNTNSTAMLIYNKKLSVCPLTTHLPIKLVSNSINKKMIAEKIYLIDKFYKEYLGYKPRIALTGLNPHCESIDNQNEDEKIILPTINKLKKKYNIEGPYAADTIFLNNVRKEFDIIIGMYHDQVISPMKTIFEFDAINITLGLPFIRISPDHGPNEKMMGKNTSNPKSLIKALEFLDKN